MKSSSVACTAAGTKLTDEAIKQRSNDNRVTFYACDIDRSCKSTCKL